jgi:glycosyltransferase involved in cell wall biosynthesis
METMFTMFRSQTYPKEKLEWIIVDDGTDKIEDLVKASGIEQIKYISKEDKITVGAKRNLMHTHLDARCEIVVYMDDDDYYPSDRIAHAVQRLLDNPNALCAGSSEMYIVFKDLDYPDSLDVYQAGPYGPNHATAATFAFRKKLLEDHRYDDAAALSEESAFLQKYTVPFVQLDPKSTILVFSHDHNSFDKRNLIKPGGCKYFKKSDKKVEDFIKLPEEKAVLDFFLNVNERITPYKLGLPENKPDVVQEIDRRRQNTRPAPDQDGIRMSIKRGDGKESLLTLAQAAKLFQDQHRLIVQLMQRLKKFEDAEKALGSLQNPPLIV